MCDQPAQRCISSTFDWQIEKEKNNVGRTNKEMNKEEEEKGCRWKGKEVKRRKNGRNR